MYYALSSATFVVAILTVLPLWRHPHWVVRSMDFPRVQLSILIALLLLAQLMLLSWDNTHTVLIIGTTAICLIWQLCWVLPYTPLWPVEVKAAKRCQDNQSISILTANVLRTNRNAQALIDLVALHQPDVLVTLESDEWWQIQLDTLQSDMPYSVKCPLDNLYGMHVYSRYPLEDSEIKYLVEEGVPSIHTLLRLNQATGIRIHFMHPAPPSPTENTESAERDAELLIVGKSIVDSVNPVIVTGDLNDVAWSATTRLFRKISGLLDPRVGRGMFNTFHAKVPLFRWPLDHLFHSSHFKLCSIQRLPPIGSDHFALLTVLCYNPTEHYSQQGLVADAADQRLAESKIEEKLVTPEEVPSPGE